ncbi:hypothetical protein [Streptomyces hygroscopicus]|uniref:hypothetical protein n=1 Tax=Streptomyces hygroscopicus TaxID=1912 RepID=UPI003F4D5BE9
MEPATQLRLDRLDQVGRPLDQVGNRVKLRPGIAMMWSAGETGYGVPRHNFSSCPVLLGIIGNHPIMLRACP